MPAARLEREDAAGLLSLLDEVPRAVLAFSGGADSTCLAWLASHHRACKFLCVTVDHGLRAESAIEAQAAREMAIRLGHEAIIQQWQGVKPKSGIQAAARQARYHLLAEAARAFGAGVIVTAHNLEDVAETFLMRLARGSGLDGLSSMAEDGELSANFAENFADLRLVRPLLSVSRAQIEATLRSHKLSWSEDPSNRAENFERVRVRQAMQQFLPEFGLSAEKIALAARRLARARDAVRQATQQWQLLVWPDGDLAVPFCQQTWRQAPEEIRIRLLNLVLPGSEMAQIEALAGWLQMVDEGARTLAGYEIRLNAGFVDIRVEKPRRNSGL